MGSIIEHTGYISKINDGEIYVQISQVSACSECLVKSACAMSERKIKEIIIKDKNTEYRVGEKVKISGKSSYGLYAVFLAFVIPFIIILTSLLLLEHYKVDEVVAAFISLALLILYYFILHFFNKKLTAKLNFTIEKNNLS